MWAGGINASDKSCVGISVKFHSDNTRLMSMDLQGVILLWDKPFSLHCV